MPIIAQKWQLLNEDKVKTIESNVQRENRTIMQQKSENLQEIVSPS